MLAVDHCDDGGRAGDPDIVTHASHTRQRGDTVADTRSHPHTAVGPDPEAPTGTSRWQKAVAIVGVLVVLWVGSDTYKVIDGDFGGGGGTPAENQDPSGGGGHTPGPPAGGH
jgi:hypothetical protein